MLLNIAKVEDYTRPAEKDEPMVTSLYSSLW